MEFHTPSWVPQVSVLIPDDKLVGDFVVERKHNLFELSDEKPAVVCALSGKSYTIPDIKNRVSNLSKALSKRFGWSPNSDSPWNKVVAILSPNTVSAKLRTYPLLSSIYPGGREQSSEESTSNPLITV